MTVASLTPAKPASKLAEQVALRIEADIMAGGWQVGTSVGTAAELQERYGVSRAVIREAIRLVEHHEAAAPRRGTGGLIIRAPDLRSATGAALIYLEWADATLADLLEARAIIEPLAASIAAEAVPENQIETLRATAEGEGDLHIAIARASGSAVLAVFVEILALLTRRYSAAVVGLAEQGAPASAEAVETHRQISEAVAAGDGPRARAAMAAHLDALRGTLGANPQTSQLLRELAPSAAHRLQSTGSMKLAEAISHQIRKDILDSDYPAGYMLGSESDLLERHQVSRAVLREAIRILEWHSVITTQRGPGGGILVAAPVPDAGIDAIALYLNYEKAGLEDIAQLRSTLELACVAKVCERADDPEVRSRLRAALKVGLGTPRADLNLLSNHVHTELCDLSGNPVLAMFSRILTALWARFNATPLEKSDVTDARVVEQVATTHRLIVEAVLAGDQTLARHRMSRHLSALTKWWE